MLVYGTRPEAIKMAPLVLALREAPGFTPVVASTGQHREMLDQVNALFGITADVDLDVMSARQSLSQVTERVLGRLSPVIEEVAPDLVVVQGDTTTTFCGALAAFYQDVPVAHVEAGRRTGNARSPFPEEINRRMTTQLASLHLAPTSTSGANLLAEGVAADRVIVTGNTVIDALLWAVHRAGSYGDPALEGLDADPRRVLLVTSHRRESWGDPMRSIGRAIARIATAEPDLLVVFPIHRNPVVREAILPTIEGLDNVVVCEPLGYGGFSRLLGRAHVVLTDSGGVQEEAPSLGKPVLVLRDNTERPEAVEAGTVRLVGTDEERIVTEVRALLHDPSAYADMANAVNPYGDGLACGRTIAAFRHLFGEGGRPEEFVVRPTPAVRTAVPA